MIVVAISVVTHSHKVFIGSLYCNISLAFDALEDSIFIDAVRPSITGLIANGLIHCQILVGIVALVKTAEFRLAFWHDLIWRVAITRNIADNTLKEQEHW